ncbi:MAG TPA: hypothetical protein VNN73_11990 [Blastocatellia bacterium]|nr:hypothetical protein [Blastocatellia bacterium]
MRTRVAIHFCLLIALSFSATFLARAQVAQSNAYGPEVKAFLDFMRQEETELDFQIRHNEIARREYIRSKNRIAIHRQTVLSIAKQRGEDYVPEIHVVAAAEVNQIIEGGLTALKGIRQGDVINQKWRYLGSVTRGEVFHIFERITPE